MKRTKPFLLNILLIISSVLFCVILLEFFVFRFVLVASDFPKLDFVDGVLKYRPNQAGIFRVKNEIKAGFHINQNGWNSKHDQYAIERSNGKLRVAIIGDSKVEAFQVNYDESLAEQTEQGFNHAQVEVYRFAISGAPLSQYLHLLRTEALKYSPDLVVIILVQNDFDESYLPTPGVYTRSFLKINITNDTVEGEISPLEYQVPWYGYIRSSATWRYLTYRQQFHFSSLRKIFFRRQRQERISRGGEMNESGPDLKMKRNKLLTEYVFKEMKEISETKNAELLIIMEGDSDNIYKNAYDGKSTPEKVLLLTGMAGSVAEDHGIDFIELQPIFENDFRVNHKEFYFRSDSHWNKHGHKLVAGVIVDFIESKLLNLRN